MNCAICAVRRPKRLCPGVGGEICSICCGTGREQTVSCPLDCEYLQDARRHEKANRKSADELPDKDIKVTDEFLNERQALVMALGGIVSGTALETAGAVDSDLRDALAALVRTYRTLVAGVYYETVPENAVAARVFRGVQDGIQKLRDEERRNLGIQAIRDGDLLRCLVFLEQVAVVNDNGRRRGRAAIDLLLALASPEEQSPAAPRSLLVLP
ncbi:MAG TPA: hypothetical protein VKV17_20245 [Bryobacteraceae bacterium]|nr:hypothetical protein [Bryobacteraceae bacterium]